MTRRTRKPLKPLARPSGWRRGFTLLEVLLALGLSIAVISAISYAIYFHLRVLDSQRLRVEQSLVARGVLNLVANDIRAAVQYKPVDVSQLEALLSSVDLATLLSSSAGEEMLNSALGSSGIDPSALTGDDGSLSEEAVGAEMDAAAGEEGPRPGLYGTSTELQIDISRMPRRDQYMYGVQTAGNDYASDLRSVAYRLVPTESLDPELVLGVVQSSNSSLSVGTQNGTGMSLVRSTVSQAVRRYEQATGDSSETFGVTEVLADEVSNLQFRYFDGSQGAWVEEWDTDEMESLPTAVEINVEFQFRQTGFVGNASTADQMGAESYRLVVHLPLAEPPEEESTDDSSSSASQSGGTSSDSSGGEASGR